MLLKGSKLVCLIDRLAQKRQKAPNLIEYSNTREKANR